jgi:predicted dehydrogenase
MSVLTVGIIGGGEIVQTVHLPNLWRMRGRFRVAALADPSRKVREALAARYGIPGVHSSHTELIAAGGLDAVVICSPHGAHAEAILEALDAGLHVFVEKPLCITLTDVDRIIAARDRAARVVQVGYMNRFDEAFEWMCADMPSTAQDLRCVNVVTYDPRLGQFFLPEDMVFADDVPSSVSDATRAATADQVRAAVGRDDRGSVFAFSEIFLGTLVHDVNVVHGLLDAMHEPVPPAVVDAACWADGYAAAGTMQLASGGRWTTTFMQLEAVHDFRMAIALYFPESVRTLTLPAPYLRQSPTRYARAGEQDGVHVSREVGSFRESYVRELEHFHDCVVHGRACKTPPEQARTDTELLTAMFRHWIGAA